MNIHIIFFVFLCSLFDYYDNRQVNKVLFVISFFWLFILFSYRIDFGNDFIHYESLHSENRVFYRDILFFKFLYFFDKFENFIFFSSLFCFLTIYLFTKDFDAKQRFVFFLLLFLNVYFFTLGFSSIRQSMAVYLFLIGCWLYLKTNYKSFIFITILICLFIHQSAFILFILFFLCFVPNRKFKYEAHLIVFIYFTLVIFLNHDVLFSSLKALFSDSSYARLLVSLSDTGHSASLKTKVVQSIMFLSFISLFQNTKVENLFVYRASIIYFLLFCFSYIDLDLVRLAMYFDFFIILFFALHSRFIFVMEINRFNLSFILFSVVYSTRYFNFFSSELYGEHFNYLNLFFF